MNQRAFIIFSLFWMLSAQSAAATPREELIGYWKMRRGIGGPCASQIRTLSYYFGKDGKYHAEANMIRGGEFKAAGTYKADDSTAVAYVDGSTIGPYPYRIEDGILVIDHPQFHCRIELDREDY